MLSSWAKRYDLTSISNVRFAVQIPRIFQVWRGNGTVVNFGEILQNFFEPIFLATLEPEKNAVLASFLKCVHLFDSVDDEVSWVYLSHRRPWYPNPSKSNFADPIPCRPVERGRFLC